LTLARGTLHASRASLLHAKQCAAGVQHQVLPERPYTHAVVMAGLQGLFYIHYTDGWVDELTWEQLTDQPPPPPPPPTKALPTAQAPGERQAGGEQGSTAGAAPMEAPQQRQLGMVVGVAGWSPAPAPGAHAPSGSSALYRSSLQHLSLSAKVREGGPCIPSLSSSCGRVGTVPAPAPTRE
jgi:hypothetical protein